MLISYSLTSYLKIALDFLKITANTSQVISSRTFFICTACVVVLQFH